MSSQPAEPEKYSLDDMLERLQNKPSSETDDSGELVTRADGTQAIKVRKRKRRSTQPHKEAAKKASRMRAFQVSSVVLLLILLALTLGGLIVYANSSPYRKGVIAKFNTATGAKTEFQQLMVSPTGSVANQVRFQWPEGNQLKSLTLTGVRAQALMGGIMGSRWGVDEVSAASGTLVIGTPQGGEPLRFFPKQAGNPPVSIERLAVASLNLNLGDPSSPAVQLLKTEASFYPENVEGLPSVRLFRGEARVPNWPLFRVDRGLLEFRGSEISIVSLRLFHELDNTGNIELSGKFDPSDLRQEQSLDVKMNSFNLNGIAGSSLGHLVAGRIDSRDTGGPNQLTFSSAKPHGKLTISFASAPNTLPRLNNFSFLGKLSQITDNPWFLDPLFHDGCTGLLHRENGVVRISDLSLTSKNQLKVTGDLSLQPNDSLSGTLNIGLPEATVMGGRNPALPKVFAESHDGFRWVTLKISGTGSRPTDDFLERIQAAGGLSVTSDAPHAPQDMFERLTAPKDK